MRRRRFLAGSALALAGLAWGAPKPARATRARIVVIGGGFAGSTCALYLRRLAPEFDVALVDPDERYTTCPLSNEVLVSWRTLDSLTISRRGLADGGVRFVRAHATAVDAHRREVHLDDKTILAYDRLVVAPGIRFLFGQPLGYDATAVERMPHAWKAGAQTALLAAQLRAMPDGGVVAISVPIGPMRCPPAPYERASLIAGYLKKHKPRSKVLIFDANNHFPRQDFFSDAWRSLYPGMIDWIPVIEGGKVERVDPAGMILYTDRGAHPVAIANVIPPQAPDQIAVDAGLASAHGWCPIDASTFASELVDHVHVIGDACIAGAMPKAASAAHSQGVQCAHAIVSALEEHAAPRMALSNTCYALASRARGVAIHGTYHVIGDRIIANTSTHPDAERNIGADDAEHWYQRLRAEAFGS